MSDAIALRNRFAMVKGAWDEHLRGVPFPALGEGTAEEKIERLEIALVDEMRRRATPETAEQAADAMWTLVHARADDDPVKVRVTAAPRGARAPRAPPDLDSRMPPGRPPASATAACTSSSCAPGAARRSRCAGARKTDPAYPKYPRVPVLRCPGHEARP